VPSNLPAGRADGGDQPKLRIDGFDVAHAGRSWAMPMQRESHPDAAL